MSIIAQKLIFENNAEKNDYKLQKKNFVMLNLH